MFLFLNSVHKVLQRSNFSCKKYPSIITASFAYISSSCSLTNSSVKQLEALISVNRLLSFWNIPTPQREVDISGIDCNNGLTPELFKASIILSLYPSFPVAPNIVNEYLSLFSSSILKHHEAVLKVF